MTNSGPSLQIIDGLRPQPAAGVVCIRDGHVLLIRRGTPPLTGAWSLPGGRIEPGERASDAALRELYEETGVQAEIAGLIDVVDAIIRNRENTLITRHYVLCDYAARWISGEPAAGDDAAEAQFVALGEIGKLRMWNETERIVKAGAALLNSFRENPV